MNRSLLFSHPVTTVLLCCVALVHPATPLSISSSDISVSLSPVNGAITSISANAVSVPVSSHAGCLWGSWSDTHPDSYAGGCSFSPSSTSHTFSFKQTSTSAVTLTYTSTATASPTVSASVSLSVAGSVVTAALTLSSSADYTIHHVAFPSELALPKTSVSSGFLPLIPGVSLSAEYFTQPKPHSWSLGYPGGMFADVVSVSTTAGSSVAVMSVPDSPTAVTPVDVGFVFYSEDTTVFAIEHTYATVLSPGRSWTSPDVHIVIGGSVTDTARHYAANRNLPSVARKLPAKLSSVYAKLSTAALVKADSNALNTPFSQYASKFFPHIPSNALFHPAAYEVGGFDTHYPDMLPPASRFGSEEDMAGMFNAAREAGMLVMPYTNPTWWDPRSDTLQNLPTGVTLSDVTALNATGQPIVESYGPNSGVVSCVRSPFVQDRLHRLARNFTAGGRVVSDALFQDQIGARPYLRDYSPHEPNGPMGYSASWVAHTANTSQLAPIMTERGFDALSPFESGFHGSVLLDQAGGNTVKYFGSDSFWRPFPFGPMISREYVIFYQHDLATQTMTTSTAHLSWNLAMGYALSFDFSPYPHFDVTWLTLAAQFQLHVVSTYLDQPLTGFNTLTGTGGDVTVTSFGDGTTVSANWNSSSGHSVAGGRFTLAPSGCLVVTPKGVTAGAVSATFNGHTLTGGVHHIVVAPSVSDATVSVFQPVGASTPIAVSPVSGWAAGNVTVVGCASAASPSAPVSVSSVPFDGSNPVVFQYVQGTDRYVLSQLAHPMC